MNEKEKAGLITEQELINAVEALLQQTTFNTLRDGLQKMLNNEQKNFGEHYFITDEVREKQLNLKAIAHVLKLVDACKPVT
jgi:hypothetical protein